MKERGIIFNGDMVRAILDGCKTQTRRALTPRHLKMIEAAAIAGECYPLESGKDHENSQAYYRDWCPFGKVGDRLWVRESFQGPLVSEELFEEYRAYSDKFETPEYCEYAADGGARPEYCDLDDNVRHGWRPSIHMPRWASRITLEITGVRVERLNDISEQDAIGEGVARRNSDTYHGFYRDYENEGYGQGCTFANDSFRSLWKSIYGAESWDANPFVWVINFKRMEAGS